MSRIDEIAARHGAATKGPWKAFIKNGIESVMIGKKEVVHWHGFDSSDFQRQRKQNCAFIAASWSDIEYLLAEVARLERLLEQSDER